MGFNGGRRTSRRILSTLALSALMGGMLGLVTTAASAAGGQKHLVRPSAVRASVGRTAVAQKHVVRARPATAQAPGTRPAGGVVPATAPPGYAVVTNGPLTALNGVQSSGSAVCPVNTRVFGGGASVASSSLFVNLNSSYPSSTGKGWTVDINNASGSSTTFNVYAICGAKPKDYHVVASSVTMPPQRQTGAAAICPSGKVLGGGGFSSSTSTSVSLNSTVPIGDGWLIYVNNGTGKSQSAEAWAVCGKGVKGRSKVIGSVVDNPPGTQTSASIACPGASIPISGGIFSDAPLNITSVSVGGSYPLGSGWQALENNADTADQAIQVAMICAGT